MSKPNHVSPELDRLTGVLFDYVGGKDFARIQQFCGELGVFDPAQVRDVGVQVERLCAYMAASHGWGPYRTSCTPVNEIADFLEEQWKSQVDSSQSAPPEDRHQQWMPAREATKHANNITGVERDWSSYWRRFCLKHAVAMRPGTRADGASTDYWRDVEFGSLFRAIEENAGEFKDATPEQQGRHQRETAKRIRPERRAEARIARNRVTDYHAKLSANFFAHSVTTYKTHFTISLTRFLTVQTLQELSCFRFSYVWTHEERKAHHGSS